ncbi:type I-E CRISPR-associated protein Cse1/CasA [Streptomyces sp. CB03578]|uniref:type I-E CRISPR-associated protein Cse1/CasA n=1 Tax=Streptomyces sp. CB03578 TaxID=1718987 RepID=UPI00093B7E34|nr:type I-E CRISPR-associated protein Cse1/CasA [Streptomyces sp. CB03578]OKI31565.1 type I-E CRISPR-associated protein Cse1/CasA [Streptomyces sp. CB03578]
MTDGFDLRDERWIPVRLADGVSLRVGLRELFHRADEIADLELPVPPAASGLLRILAAMTSRIAGCDGVRLDDEDLGEDINGWLRLRNRVLAEGRFDPKLVNGYLDQEVPKGHLDLFDGDRPFLQDPRLRSQCVDGQGRPNPSGVNKLVFGRPTGVNGAVWFGHFTDGDPVPVPAAEAVWHLIAQLYYGPSGQCTPRKITEVKPGNGDAGPVRKSVSYHPWADDLFTTLVLAIPQPGACGDPAEDDACPWEEDALADPLGPLAPASWPGRVLTGRARHAVLLEPSQDRRLVTQAYLTWSTHAPPHAVRDPYVILDMPKAGGAPFARPADGSRALWRDLDALLLKGGGQSRRPAAFENLPRTLRTGLRVRAYGFDQDGQQRDSSWFEATTPPVLQWREDGPEPDMALRVGQCRESAELVGERLRFAARLAWRLATEPEADAAARVKLDPKKPGPWAHAAAAHFWPSAEAIFWSLLSPGGRQDTPLPLFIDAALAALDGAIGARSADLRVARARIRARAVLRALLQAGPARPSATTVGSDS